MSDYITVYVKYKNQDGEDQECITYAERKGKKIILDEEFTEFDKNPIIKTWKEIDDPDWLIIMCDDELENANRHNESFSAIFAAAQKYIKKGKECDFIRAVAEAMDCNP